jgi:anti-sigma regulatory factor (Ser/Thr protein kinase)
MRLAALKIPAQPEFVSIARLVVSTVAGDRYELSDDQIESLKLAVSEACVMSIKGSDHGDGRQVVLQCEGTDERIDITVGSQSAREIKAEDSDSEFGLTLVESLVDEVVANSDADGTSLRLTLFSTLAEEL